MSACRFCGKGNGEDRNRLNLIKYGVRHYAHPDCGLKAKGSAFFDSLHDWQLVNFPALAADRAGLFDVLVDQIAKRTKERRA